MHRYYGMQTFIDMCMAGGLDASATASEWHEAQADLDQDQAFALQTGVAALTALLAAKRREDLDHTNPALAFVGPA
eukprot:9453232-Heterocapsa_arctica.AAC.1